MVFVSSRKVGNTAKVCLMSFWTEAVAENTVSPVVIRLRSAAWFRLRALNTTLPLLVSRTTAACSTSRTWRMSVASAAKVGRFPSTLFRFWSLPWTACESDCCQVWNAFRVGASSALNMSSI